MRSYFISFAALLAAATTITASPRLNSEPFTISGIPTHHGLQDIPLDDLEDGLVHEHVFEERSALCAGVDMRSRSGLAGAQVGPPDCTRAATQSPGNGLNAWYAYSQNPVKVTARTDIKTAVVTKYPFNKNMGKKTCDHVMEIQVLLKVLNAGGANSACRIADTMNTMTTYDGNPVTEGQKLLLEIREEILRPKNLISIQARVEELKTQLAQRWDAGQLATFPIFGKDKKGDTHAMDFLAMGDYLLRKTTTWSLETAARLDAAIATRFPNSPAGGVVKTWNEFLAFAQVAIEFRRRAVLQEIENLKRQEGCSQGAGPKKGGPSKPARRRLSADDFELGFTPFPKSSLQRRQRAAKSGPHAPGAPCCPPRNQPQKKVVPKSKTKTRPPPARKPRSPAKRPATRAPAKRTVAKRPATRARRQVGKPAPRKRVTPRKRPRKVPKPTRRPKGKARPRRRRR